MLGQSKKAINQKSKVTKPFNCPQCKVKATTIGDLKKHVKTSHSKLFTNDKVSSKYSAMMNEDLSILDTTDNSIVITLDENADEKPAIECDDKPAIDCDWDPCNYNSSDKSLLIEHIGVQHLKQRKAKKVLPKLEDIFSCKLCDYDSENQSELDNHMEFNIHAAKFSHQNNLIKPTNKEPPSEKRSSE